MDKKNVACTRAHTHTQILHSHETYEFVSFETIQMDPEGVMLSEKVILKKTNTIWFYLQVESK